MTRFHIWIAGAVLLVAIFLSASVIGANQTCIPCGDSCYDPSKQSCCQGQVYDGLRWGVCKGVCFNLEKQVCCNGVPVNGTRCLPTCGSSFYNPVTQSCCQGEPKDGLLWGICGGKCYDLTNGPAVIIRYTPEPDGRSVAIPVIIRITRAVVWDRCMMGRGTQVR
jgi:hypothetical protein